MKLWPEPRLQAGLLKMYKARKWYGLSTQPWLQFFQKVRAPDGYPFFIVDLPQPVERDPVVSVGIFAI